jgi:hypothetical protein
VAADTVKSPLIVAAPETFSPENEAVALPADNVAPVTVTVCAVNPDPTTTLEVVLTVPLTLSANVLGPVPIPTAELESVVPPIEFDDVGVLLIALLESVIPPIELDTFSGVVIPPPREILVFPFVRLLLDRVHPPITFVVLAMLDDIAPLLSTTLAIV